MVGRGSANMGLWLRGALTVGLLCLTAPLSRAQAGGVVCGKGFGQFSTTFSTGVSVRVGPAHVGGFAQHTCEAVLTDRGDRLVAIPSAAKVDIDVMGVNLGFGGPVVAFESWSASNSWQATYAIYSLDKHPRLLRTITGGDEYRAIDAGFNKRVAIWTTDAAAVDGLDDLTYADFDAPPTVVLDFQHDRLMDVSAWYRRQYDKQIAQLRGQLDAQDLTDFRASDGRLRFDAMPPALWVRLRRTKVKVLEIALAYLYSGRAAQAWAELSRDWPPTDVAGIKAEILAARASGIEAQVAGVASAKLPPKWNDTPFVYAYLMEHQCASPVVPRPAMFGDLMSRAVLRGNQPNAPLPEEAAADTAPQPILVWRPEPWDAEAAQGDQWETMMLTIDEAGKVHAAKMVDSTSDAELLRAAMHWRFIPAFRDGKPVAYKLKFQVMPYQ